MIHPSEYHDEYTFKRQHPPALAAPAAAPAEISRPPGCLGDRRVGRQLSVRAAVADQGQLHARSDERATAEAIRAGRRYEVGVLRRRPGTDDHPAARLC